MLSGAGISAESGIRTFRDSGGLWEDHDIMEVASPEGWKRNPQLVTGFYNARRTALADVQPNAGHLALKELEDVFEVHVITQNVDDLHERAGSANIIHLHGELTKMRSEKFRDEVFDVGYRAVEYGVTCPKGNLLRPHVVWFGEEVPMMETAVGLVEKAEMMIVVGTSLEVYPAAGLLGFAGKDVPVYLIDPNRETAPFGVKELIRDTAAHALPELVRKLKARFT